MAALLLAAGALALFGCGGGGSSGSSLTKAEFIKQVNQKCQQEAELRAQAKAETEKELNLESNDIANPAQHQQIVEALLVPYESMTNQIEELVPSSQEEKVEPLIEAREEVAQIVRETASTEITLPAIKKATDRARQFGLDECTL